MKKVVRNIAESVKLTYNKGTSQCVSTHTVHVYNEVSSLPNFLGCRICDVYSGTLRIRQGWFKLWSRVGGLVFVINGSYIITGKQQNLAFAA